jgi:glutathione S-transferase
MMRLWDHLKSGNGYKVRLVLTQLGIPFERVELDIERGETRTPEFLARNANGRIPVLEYEPGRFLAESNAILFYLADGTPLLPDDRLGRAETLQWMFFEQYSHEPYIATSRHWILTGKAEERRELLAAKRDPGYAALGVMEGRLRRRPFFVADRYSIADVALYAYTHVAHEGGFDLAGFPSVREWLARVAGQPRHVPITDT